MQHIIGKLIGLAIVLAIIAAIANRCGYTPAVDLNALGGKYTVNYYTGSKWEHKSATGGITGYVGGGNTRYTITFRGLKVKNGNGKVSFYSNYAVIRK